MELLKKSWLLPLVIFVSAVAIRLLFVFFILYDSDEITWTIIGRRVLSGEDFHLWFLNQKYMGAIEGYIVGVAQSLFGYNLVTLRINSIIFSAMTAVAIFLILKKIAGTKYGILGAVIFHLASYDVTSNFTKAWGNRPLISLIGVFIIYSSWLLFFRKHKLSKNREGLLAIVTGFILGLGFFANLENVYFILIGFGIYLLSLVDIKNIRAIKTIRFPKINLELIVSILFYFLLFWIYYIIFTRKSLFNPYETLAVKLGTGANFLKFLDFSLETIVSLVAFYAIATIKLIFYPSRHAKLRNMSLMYSLFTVGAFFAISRNSVERTNQIINSVKEQSNFLVYTLLQLFFGISINIKNLNLGQGVKLVAIFLMPAVSIFVAVKQSLTGLVKNKKVDLSLANTYSLYILIPSMFVISQAGGINSSSRYITNLWPGFVILYVYGIYLTVKKLKLVGVLLVALIIGIYSYNYFKAMYPTAINGVLKKEYAQTDYIKAADYFLEQGIKNCYAGYWHAYGIMFETDFKVICSPSEYFGYGENETPFNTQAVDRDPNPAFVFTTEKRVGDFKRKWVGKDVKIIREDVVGRYYIFQTQRIKHTP